MQRACTPKALLGSSSFATIKPCRSLSQIFSPARQLQLRSAHKYKRGSDVTLRPVIVRAAAAPEVEAPSFDWRLGLALAGCSFEAYNGLTEQALDAHLKQVSPTGTETTYVDSKFIKSRLRGVMEVTVKSASGLPAADWWPGSKADPYAQITIGRSTGRSKTIKQNLNPSWGDEKLYIFVQNSAERVSVRMMDEDIDADDLMGAGMLSLSDIMDGEVHEVEVPLKSVKGKQAGTVKLGFKFLSFADEGVVEDARSSMGAPVLGSPAREIFSSPWRKVKNELIPAEAAADALFDPVAYIDNPSSDTQAWLFWNPDLRKACLAFRGTEQTKWKDIFTDLSIVPGAFTPEDVQDTEQEDIFAPASKALKALQSGLNKKDPATGEGPDFKSVVADSIIAAAKPGNSDQVWVHSGFLKAYKSIQSDIFAILDMLLAEDKEPWTLYITGHSLGGALATLSAYDCGKRRSWKGPKPELVMYTFGGPRVGNTVFADEFDALIPNAWRVVNKNDAVSLVPRMMGFSHAGHKITLGEGAALVEMNSSKGLGEGKVFAEVAASMLASSILGDSSTSSADGTGDGLDVKGLLDQEMTAMNAIMDGSAVEEHLEPVYLENMKQAFEKSDVV